MKKLALVGRNFTELLRTFGLAIDSLLGDGNMVSACFPQTKSHRWASSFFCPSLLPDRTSKKAAEVCPNDAEKLSFGPEPLRFFGLSTSFDSFCEYFPRTAGASGETKYRRPNRQLLGVGTSGCQRNLFVFKCSQGVFMFCWSFMTLKGRYDSYYGF